MSKTNTPKIQDFILNIDSGISTGDSGISTGDSGIVSQSLEKPLPVGKKLSECSIEELFKIIGKTNKFMASQTLTWNHVLEIKSEKNTVRYYI